MSEKMSAAIETARDDPLEHALGRERSSVPPGLGVRRVVPAPYPSAGLKESELRLEDDRTIDPSRGRPVVDPLPRGPEALSGAAEPAPVSRVGRNLSALATGQLVTWTMTLIWTLIVPRSLGSFAYGVIVSAQSVAGVVSIVLGLGTRNFLVREIVIKRDDGAQLIGTALVLRLVLAPLVALAAVIWAQLAHDSHQATVVLYLITAMTVMTLLADPMQAAFQAIERMRYMAVIDVINKAGQSLLGIAIVTVGLGAVGVAASMASMAGIVVVLYAICLRRFFRIDLRTNARLMGGMVKASCAYWTFGLCQFFYLWIDTILLTLLTRSEVVGWYGASTQLFQTLMFLPVLVSTAWLPRLVAAFSDSRDHLLNVARTPLEFVLVISAPMAAGTAMVAPPLIHAIYGPAFANAVPVLVVLAFCIPPIYLNIMLAQVLMAEKRQAIWTVIMAGAAVVNPVFNLVLIPATEHRYHNGAIGAAVSLVLTEVVMDIVGLIVVGRDLFDRTSLRRCALAVAAATAMWWVSDVLRPIGVPLSVLAGVATFALLLAVLPIASAEEVAVVKSGIARLRRMLRGRGSTDRPQAAPNDVIARPRAVPHGPVAAPQAVPDDCGADPFSDTESDRPADGADGSADAGRGTRPRPRLLSLAWPRLPHRGLRVAALLFSRRVRLRKCSRVGPRTRVSGKPAIENRGFIGIGARVVLHSDVAPIELAALDGGRICIGDRTVVNVGVVISARAQVVIGDSCLLGRHVTITDNYGEASARRDGAAASRAVFLGQNVSLGDGVVVRPGVSIGDGTVIGARSVVVDDLPPRCLAIGKPARPVEFFALSGSAA